MKFNSALFLEFFLVVLALVYLLPARLRWYLLIVSSFIFYMAHQPWDILILLFQAFTVYLLGKRMEPLAGKSRKSCFVTSLTLTVGVLIYYKYSGFLVSTLIELGKWIRLPWAVTLSSARSDEIIPLGISFYTFQAVRYTFDIYAKKFPAEKSFGSVLLYLLFWPHMMAGPILRPHELLPQLRSFSPVPLSATFDGFKWMLRGFFKKVVIADQLGPVVNQVFNNPSQYDSLGLLFGIIFFATQIYCDFSGYCDIAIGAAKCLGIELRINFNQPYFASSFRDFWKRWHITLSEWFRDCVYIPLGGNRGSSLKTLRNLLITFSLSGLWHGANWTFLVWGFLNGTLVAFEHVLSKPVTAVTGKLPLWIRSSMRILYGITAVCAVNLTWVFFRANSLDDGIIIFKKLFTPFKYSLAELQENFFFISSRALFIRDKQMALCILLVAFFFTTEAVGNRWKFNVARLPFPSLFRLGIYSGLVWIILLLGNLATPQTFIYFQF